MPATVIKQFNNYSVVNPVSGHVYSKHTTLSRANAQKRILDKFFITNK